MKNSKKIALSIVAILISTFAISRGYALFTDVVTAKDNKFYSGIYDVQMSTTDADNNNIAEGLSANWSDSASNVWSTPLQWNPGGTVTSRVFIRNQGDIDAESVKWYLGNRSFFGAKQLDQVINLTKAWYDRNANGVQDTGEDLLPSLIAAYDHNGGNFTMRDLYDGTDLVHGGTAFDLEAGTAVLPGIKTSSSIGGYTGTGKGLFLTWQFDPTADASYNNAWVNLDFVFSADQKVS